MSGLRTALITVAIAALAVACDPAPSPLGVRPDLAKGGNGDSGGPVKVDVTDPAEAPQDTTLTVRILGSGFEKGSQARFLVSGSDGGVTTNRTRFVSETELEADISVAADATVALYDVEVASSGGRRRGVGTELFRVQEKTGGGVETGEAATILPEPGTAGLTSDGEGTYLTIRKRNALESEVTSDGRHWLRLNDRSRRDVCVTFPGAGEAEIVSPEDWADLVDVSGGQADLGSTYCGLVTMHTRDHTNPEKLPGTDTDPTTPDRLNVHASGGKLVLKELDRNADWEWRLFFDDKHTGVNGGAMTNGVCIRRNPDQSWTIGNDPGLDTGSEDPSACDAVDEWMNLIRMVPQSDGTVEYRHVARLRVPFSYRVLPLF